MIKLVDLNAFAPESRDDPSIQGQTYKILDQALNNLLPTELTAESTAGEIDKLYASKSGDQGAEDFLYEFWNFFVKVVKKVPADNRRQPQQLLITTLDRLKSKDRETAQVWREDTKVWGDLPLLGPAMRDAWNTRPNFEKEEANSEAVTEWRNLNSFAARMLGAKIQEWKEYALWELRSALEEESSSNAAKEGQLVSALEWLNHAPKALYELGQQQGELSDQEARMFKAGGLFEGKPGFNDERWKFWTQRVEALSKEVESEEVKERAGKVVSGMQKVDGTK